MRKNIDDWCSKLRYRIRLFNFGHSVFFKSIAAWIIHLQCDNLDDLHDFWLSLDHGPGCVNYQVFAVFSKVVCFNTKQTISTLPSMQDVPKDQMGIMDALLMMVSQYLACDIDGERVLDHVFMSAGEFTLDLLENMGYVKPWEKNPNYYVFTEKAND
jgi:hypothetical protein